MLGAADDDVLLGYVGRLVPIKRVDVIIRAVAELSRCDIDLKVAIVGDGMSREGLERLAAGLEVADRITFTGYVRDIRSILAACDIAILSSDNEGTPVSLIEAAAAGVPAVSTAVGGVPEVVGSQTGILVPRGDAHAFAAAVAQLATNPDLRARMAHHARAHATSRFRAERLTSDMESLYQELLRA
jgi:glycosyltransferase involved in cell wall biosynthesis